MYELYFPLKSLIIVIGALKLKIMSSDEPEVLSNSVFCICK